MNADVVRLRDEKAVHRVSGGRSPSMAAPDVPFAGWRDLPPAPAAVGHRLITPTTADYGLGFDPASVRGAREFAAAVLAEWDLLCVCADVRLVVSELVANACRHAAPRRPGPAREQPIQLRMLRRRLGLTCMVADPSPQAPTVVPSHHFSESGRGLHIVETFSREWGWQHVDGRGKVVWATFAVPTPPDPS